MMAVLLDNYTQGQIDLLNGNDKIELIKRYDLNLMLDKNVFPHYADSDLKNDLINPVILYSMGQVNEFYPYASKPWVAYWSAVQLTIDGNALLQMKPPADNIPIANIFYYFDQHGVVTSRASQGDESGFSLSLKGGNNAEFHNHNDIGSFVVALDGVAVLSDPGCPEYLPESFTERRYESDANNSWDHPVPIVAGLLQDKGESAYGKITSLENNDELLVVTMDLSHAYPGNFVSKLVRTWRHDRKSRVITVCDEVEFEHPADFGGALLSYGQFVRNDADVPDFTVLLDEARLSLSWESNVPLKFSQETIKYPLRAKTQPTRLGYDTMGKHEKITITITIRPCDARIQ